MKLIVIFGLCLAFFATPIAAQSVSVRDLKIMSHKLAGDTHMDCVSLRVGIDQLERNVVAIDEELEKGRLALAEFSKYRPMDGITFVDALDVDVNAPRDVRIGMKRLVEIRGLAERRTLWLREILSTRGCRAYVIISD